MFPRSSFSIARTILRERAEHKDTDAE